MIKAEKKELRRWGLKQVFKGLLKNGTVLTLLLLLFAISMESCATHYKSHYKHKKIKAIPCPCESRYPR